MANDHERIIFGLDEVPRIAKLLKQKLDSCKVMTFTGSLGAGKTTLVRELLRACGVNEVITSPTFTYVNSYRTAEGQLLHHFDLYRINTLNDFVASGFDEYLYQENSRCFVEWPALIEPLLSEQVCHITLDYHGDDRRELRLICK